MSCKRLGTAALLSTAALAALLSGCSSSNTKKNATATHQPSPPALRTPPSLPPTPPLRTPVAPTAAPRVGVPGQVAISAVGFAPAEITVEAGHPVTFVNSDSTPHRVVSAAAGVFDTGEIAPGGSATVTINTVGFTDYHDADHPAIGGTITTLP